MWYSGFPTPVFWLLSTKQMSTFRRYLRHDIGIILTQDFGLSLQSSSLNHVLTSRLFLRVCPSHFQPNDSPYIASLRLVYRCHHWVLCVDTPDQHRSILRSAIQAVLTCRMGCVSCSDVCMGSSRASTIGTLCESGGFCQSSVSS